MPERGQHTSGRGKRAGSGPNCPHAGRMPTARREAVGEPGRSRHSPHGRSANTCDPEAVLAGLPAHVMDECVEDLAEAVVAMLLDRESDETDHEDNEGSDLREI